MSSPWPLDTAAKLLSGDPAVDSPAWHELLYQLVANCREAAQASDDVPPVIMECLAAALAAPGVTRQTVYSLALALLANSEQQAHMLGLGAEDPGAETLWFLTDPTCRKLLAQPALHELLFAGALYDGVLEAVLTTVRARLAGAFIAGDLPSFQWDMLLPLMNAIAAQGLLTEYAWALDGREQEQVQQLINDIDVDDDLLAVRLLLIASYQPLFSLESWEKLLSDDEAREDLIDDGFDERLIGLHWDEPRAWQRHAEAIPVMTEVSDAISKAVAEQYEQNPYPRWSRLGLIPPLGLAGYISHQLGRPLDVGGRAQPRILIAGCGTGRQALAVASIIPEASIDAVDLSRQSLGYAAMMAERLGLQPRLTFAQGDILALADHVEPGSYDVAESIGVLHHMADPAAGLASVATTLRPDGLLQLGFYSRTGRSAINSLRARFGDGRDPDSAADLRDLRRQILMDGGEDVARVRWTTDLYSLSGFRDLLFHRQEHQFDLPGIAQLLADQGLEFLGMSFADPVQRQPYRTMFPDDEQMADLDRWHQVEQANPTMFAAMYNFWCRKPAG
ncbi:MAG: class I SAM-dependent methyltransferase [Alphaproteobacteria bacterium]|nr:class I SAM-dependent methyltransferase [Alphaproteobacteria bacterium SS10]